MAVNLKQMELDRLVNMTRAFGWDLAESRFDPDKTVAVFSRSTQGIPRDVSENEVNRLLNMARAYEWTEESINWRAIDVLLTLHKPVAPGEGESTPIPS